MFDMGAWRTRTQTLRKLATRKAVEEQQKVEVSGMTEAIKAVRAMTQQVPNIGLTPTSGDMGYGGQAIGGGGLGFEQQPSPIVRRGGEFGPVQTGVAGPSPTMERGVVSGRIPHPSGANLLDRLLEASDYPYQKLIKPVVDPVVGEIPLGFSGTGFGGPTQRTQRPPAIPEDIAEEIIGRGAELAIPGWGVPSVKTGVRGAAAVARTGAKLTKEAAESPAGRRTIATAADESGKLRLPSESGDVLDDAGQLAVPGPATQGPSPAAAELAVETPNFVAPLRPIEDVAQEVVTSDNPILRAAIAKSGINPSVAMDTDVGKGVTAYWRQRIATDELVDVAVSAAMDPHTQRFTGRRSVFNIGPKSVVKNVKDVASGQSRVWYDIFTKPQGYNLTDAQQSFVRDFHAVVRQAEEMRVAAGLPARSIDQEGWLYVPRKVKGIRGVELRRPSNPKFLRHYEEAQEGVARGVDYESDPRAVLELHLRQAYQEVLDKQLSDFMEQISVKPSALVPEGIRQRMEQTIVRRRTAERARRAFTVSREVPEPEASRLRGKLTRGKFKPGKMTAGQRQAERELVDARKEYEATKKVYGRAMESAKKAEVAPGSIFGQADETIAIGNWRNRFFVRESADELKAGLERYGVKPQEMAVARGVRLLANEIRFLSSVGDFAEPFIQGLPMLGRNPVVWSKAAMRHYQAFFDPSVQGRFMRDHLADYQELARNGVNVGDPEFFAALEAGGGLSKGKLLEFLPKGEEARRLAQLGGRQTFGRFQAAYNMGLGSTRVLYYSAIKNGWKGSQADLFSHIRNMTGALDSRALGVGPNQRALEGMWLAFSPKLLRSTVALVSDLRLGPANPRGFAAYRSLGQLAAAVTGLYVLSGLGLGKDWEEIKEGLNPLNGKKFLSHNVNGDWIGVGGQVRAITQLLADTAANPEKLGSSSITENPVTRFWSFRGAPGVNVVGGGVEALTGLDTLQFENIDSLPDLIKHLGTSALPFTVQGRLEGEQWTTTGAALTGARTSPGTPTEKKAAEFEEITGEEYVPGKPSHEERIEKEPELKELEEEARERGIEAGFEGSVKSEELRQKVADLEQQKQIPSIAAAAREGDVEALMNWKDTRADFLNERSGIYFDQFKDREPRNEAEALLMEYHSHELDKFINPRTGERDFDAWDAAREEVKSRMEPEDRAALERQEGEYFQDENANAVDKEYQKASKLVGQYYEEPRYLQDGQPMPEQQAQEIDEFWQRVQFARTQLYLKLAGEHPDAQPDQIAQALGRIGKYYFEQQVAAQMGKDIEFIRMALRARGGQLDNPDRDVILSDNIDLISQFYPDLAYGSRAFLAGLGQPQQENILEQQEQLIATR